MHKTHSREEHFKKRAANSSLRLNARGHAFQDLMPVPMELDKSFEESLGDLLIATMKAAAVALDTSEPTEKRIQAACQCNRSRGFLGNFLNKIGDPKYWQTADAFMTVARLRLPDELFESIMAETRAVRHVAAMGWRSKIQQCMNATRGVSQDKIREGRQ